mgnify:CR=1 FL=1
MIAPEAFDAFSFMELEAFLALSFNASVFEGEVAFSTLLAAVLILFSTGVDISEFSRFVGSTILLNWKFVQKQLEMDRVVVV